MGMPSHGHGKSARQLGPILYRAGLPPNPRDFSDMAEMVFCLWNSGDHIRGIGADFIHLGVATARLEEEIEGSSAAVAAGKDL
jgi:hypothetical protein